MRVRDVKGKGGIGGSRSKAAVMDRISEGVGAKAVSSDDLTLPRLNDRILSIGKQKSSKRIFDEFWRQGELSLMFGESGMGKSMLAVQIADAAARGGGVFTGFRCEAPAARVLLVDLVLSDAKFAARYSPGGKQYEFSRRLFRSRPPEGAELIEWLRKVIAANRIAYVIVDDINAVSRTAGGSIDALRAMRGLRRLIDETGISVLVIASSPRSAGSRASEHDLGRLAVLCGVADRTFALGWSREGAYIEQMRSRFSQVVWTERNSPRGVIGCVSGLPGVWFEERFADDETLRLIAAVKRSRESGKSYREIARLLQISRSRVERLLKRWRPGMRDPTSAEMAQADAEDDVDVPRYNDKVLNPESEPCGLSPDGRSYEASGPNHQLDESAADTNHAQPGHAGGSAFGPRACPFLYDGTEDAKRWFQHLLRTFPDRTDREILKDYGGGEAWCRPPGAIPPYDPDDPLGAMEMRTAADGSVLYVESSYQDGTPWVYYGYARGSLRRYTREGGGITGEAANPNLFGNWAHRCPSH